jgi:RimJ/RimL family protein N-acetyltransferase
MTAAIVRPPTADDAEAIGLAHVRAWQVAYRGLIPDEYLDGLDPVARGDAWRRVLASPHELDGASGEHLVIEVDGDVVGFAGFGPCRDDDAAGVELGELYAINLRPDAWGQGHGRRLLTAAVDGLRRRGFGEAVLWVVTGNDRARRFYEAAGWTVDGAERSDDRGAFTIPEVRYRIDLD